MKFSLVEDWKQCWRWISMNAMLVSVAMLGGYQALDETLKASLPAPVVMIVAASVLAFGAVGRLVKQKPTEPPV